MSPWGAAQRKSRSQSHPTSPALAIVKVYDARCLRPARWPRSREWTSFEHGPLLPSSQAPRALLRIADMPLLVASCESWPDAGAHAQVPAAPGCGDDGANGASVGADDRRVVEVRLLSALPARPDPVTGLELEPRRRSGAQSRAAKNGHSPPHEPTMRRVRARPRIAPTGAHLVNPGAAPGTRGVVP